MPCGNETAKARPWLFDQLRDRYEHPLEVEAYERQVARGLLAEERAIVDLALPARSRVLVLGCGAGREAFALEAMGHAVTGADISREMLKAAKRHGAMRRSSVTWVWMPDPLKVPLADASFDAVVAFAQLLSHIPGADARVALLAEVRRVLRGRGIFVASFTTRRAMREFTGEAKESPGDGARIRGEIKSASTGAAPDDAELAPVWEDGDIFVWDPSDAELDEPLFFHLHSDEEIRSEAEAAGLVLVDLVDPRRITDRPEWDAHRYPFLIARAP